MATYQAVNTATHVPEDVSSSVRIASMATYQAVNTATHVLGVVTKVVCGCVDVFKSSTCLLGPVLPVCEPIHQVYSKLFGTTTSIWESVKAQTQQCKVIGDARIS